MASQRHPVGQPRFCVATDRESSHSPTFPAPSPAMVDLGAEEANGGSQGSPCSRALFRGPQGLVPLLAPSCPDCLAVCRPPHPQASASRWKANDTSACLTGYGVGQGSW